jgi:NADH-quinone oxidoreductase subunit L
MHAMGDVIDMRQFSGLRRVLPKTHVLFAIGAAALAGLPPLAGFFSKDQILGVLLEAGRDTLVGIHFQCLLGIGFVTALLTAIYTSKAYFRTFHGPERIPDAAGHHAHEATLVMLVPMALLAVGAVFVGMLLGPTSGIGNYVTQTPGLHHSEHHEPVWILIASAAIAVAGIAVGYALSRRDPSFSSAPSGFSLATLGRNRLYIDWFYQRTIVAPMEWLAALCGWFDRGVVDEFVHFVAGLPRLVGLVGQRLQTGRIPMYSFLTAVGIAAVAIWIVTRTNW